MVSSSCLSWFLAHEKGNFVVAIGVAQTEAIRNLGYPCVLAQYLCDATETALLDFCHTEDASQHLR